MPAVGAEVAVVAHTLCICHSCFHLVSRGTLGIRTAVCEGTGPASDGATELVDQSFSLQYFLRTHVRGVSSAIPESEGWFRSSQSGGGDRSGTTLESKIEMSVSLKIYRDKQRP